MSEARTIAAPDLVRTNNEWMRRYIEEPEKFSREFEAVNDFLTDEASGVEPSYGQICAAYQFKLLDEMNSTPAA